VVVFGSVEASCRFGSLHYYFNYSSSATATAWLDAHAHLPADNFYTLGSRAINSGNSMILLILATFHSIEVKSICPLTTSNDSTEMSFKLSPSFTQYVYERLSIGIFIGIFPCGDDSWRPQRN